MNLFHFWFFFFNGSKIHVTQTIVTILKCTSWWLLVHSQHSANSSSLSMLQTVSSRKSQFGAAVSLITVIFDNLLSKKKGKASC